MNTPRPIRFRGRSKDGWYYGDIQHEFDGYNTPRTERGSTIIRHCTRPGNFHYDTVDPATVGQFTGLKDKNGREIYHGDIVKFEQRFGFHSDLLNEWKEIHGLESINGIGSLFQGIIVMDPLRGVMLKRMDNDYAEPLFTRHFEIKTNVDWLTATVIGNIHDNPELAPRQPVNHQQTPANP